MPHSLKPVKYNCLKGSAENLFGLPLISELSITLKAATMYVNWDEVIVDGFMHACVCMCVCVCIMYV